MPVELNLYWRNTANTFKLYYEKFNDEGIEYYNYSYTDPMTEKKITRLFIDKNEFNNFINQHTLILDTPPPYISSNQNISPQFGRKLYFGSRGGIYYKNGNRKYYI